MNLTPSLRSFRLGLAAIIVFLPCAVPEVFVQVWTNAAGRGSRQIRAFAKLAVLCLPAEGSAQEGPFVQFVGPALFRPEVLTTTSTTL